MKLKLIYLLSFILIGLLFISCSDIRNDIPTPSTVSVHGDGFSKVGSPNFHGNYIKNSNWNLKFCQQCHGADYSGGTTGSSCFQCHTSPQGPEACNTCHGDFSVPGRIAPPRDINGDIETTARGVGAHTIHLYENTISQNLPCEECHRVPRTALDSVHLYSPLPAKVMLGNLSKRNGALDVIYNPDNLTCSNTYCHGNFAFYKDSSANTYAYVDDKITGNNTTVTWNQVPANPAQCGTCHGIPPTGHLGPLLVESCHSCHQEVVDENGHIIDKTKHIDGKIEYNNPTFPLN
jgi:predicted CxxxxCH...CXXCH cytochrome family protein